ncbi:RING zinc finger protein-like protein [Lophiotrema nucula]|uniref:E3 ubiquitin-protein ligase listerin n=1 Tax=Lophiotrema nucula TaxID=690887 RepID=A0A6A5Z7D2_9PLEO|nr:RING zinc finger protein-like protein [Lophiotrema nucula]
MSKKAKSQASSARAATGAFGGFGAAPSAAAFGTSSSQLSYVTEPPDLSSISDPNVVVYFRNLSKKDSTTKAKALEDLQAYISSLQEPVEEGVLEAWIKMYPRTSIDNAKAVRQNAHTLQGSIAASAGKRIAKYMPKPVGAWLCGLYDSDRSVVEATQNSLRQVFNTNEKIQNIRKAYQQPILEYCRNAIDKETAQTLSDERTVSPDDAEAKYSRVISACISLLGSLLANLPPEDLSKHQSDYEALLADGKLWAFSSHGDTSIRRSTHRFLKTCLAKQPAVKTNLAVISKSYLSIALNSDQTSSAYDYIEALVSLSSVYPTVWTTEYNSKTSVERRLRQFLKKGSQSAPREYWDRLVDLLKAIPDEVLPSTGADAAELLGFLHGGIVKKDESRLSLESAFRAYLEITTLVSKRLSDQDQEKLQQELVLPIVSQYMDPSPEISTWTVPANSVALVAQATTIGLMPAILEAQWTQYTQKLIENLKNLKSEQSSGYEASQSSLLQHARRFAALLREMSDLKIPDSLQAVLAESCECIVKRALSVIRNRNGKPYGAAGTVAELLHHVPSLIASDPGTREELGRFIRDDLPRLILSPSSIKLVDILYSVADISGFEEAWTSTLQTALSADESSAKARALDAILTSARLPSSFNLAASNTDLQAYVKSNIQDALVGSLEWDTFNHMLQSPAQILSPTSLDEILSSLTQSLSITEYAPSALQGFRHIVKQNPTLLKDFISKPSGSDLLSRLLLASESPIDEIAQEASTVNASIQTILSAGTGSKDSIIPVIRRGLYEASQTSVSVETLVDLARQINKPGATWEWDSLKDVLATVAEWEGALNPFLATAPRSSLAITNPLSGAVYLAKMDGSQSAERKIPRDADGYSPAFRIAQYMVKMLSALDSSASESIPLATMRSFLVSITTTIQLATDNLGLAGANNLWNVYTPEVEADAMNFLSDAQTYLVQELGREKVYWEFAAVDDSMVIWAIGLFLTQMHDSSVRAYYRARTSSALVSTMIEHLGWHNGHNTKISEVLKQLRKDGKGNGIFPLLGYMTTFKESLAATKSCERMCNELVAELTGLNIESKPGEALQQLILLNNLLYEQEGIAQSIAKQRIIFFVKHIVSWLQDTDVPLPIRAELCRALSSILPLMGDIYGDHWAEILNSFASTWSAFGDLSDEPGKDTPIPFVHASLKLYAQFRALSQAEDPNDDLVEAWQASEKEVANGLVNLLKHSQHFPDEFHQPLKIVNEVLARQIAKVPLKHLEATEELFPLLYVESQPVQQTAFDILHKQIPEAQEQISIDAALDKSSARLPEELLSLILEAPTVAALAEANFERSVPLPLRGYLLSWLLVFDHLEHASFKVKNDYIEHIKEGDYLKGLLDFAFDFLGHAHNKPIDVSKFDITEYTPDVEPPRRDVQWLLTHLYFTALKYVPSLTKAWWISCKSRPIVVTLEPWTEKYISPPVIASALQSVTAWADAQKDEDSDSPFSVKVSPRAREITASYTIDDQTMTMLIRLPPAFPLASTHIEGLNRVAVNEAKWQSWMRTSLGAITLFNGSLIDALTTFKRNVDGAMKGQSECAICYSVVGSDRKLPDKRCSTCKNLFHGGCLFKWFRTSGSSSCPLCRNPFNYG